MATHKQKEAFKKIIDNHGNVSKTMREVGYKSNTAKNPKNLTKSKGWNELMEQHFPDNKLAQKIEEGLEANKQLATRVIIKNPVKSSTQVGELMPATEQTDDFIEVPDYPTRHKYLETALKVKDKFPSEKHDLTSQGEKLEPLQIIIIEDKHSEE